MSIDYFEELLKKPTIFVDESKLDINFIPEKLPHREKELSLLSQLFLALITKPNQISRKILITGRIGIGKTVTIKKFGNLLIEASKKRSINIEYVHINCRKERTSYKVLIKIIRVLKSNFPERGYSPQDILDIIKRSLDLKDTHLLIVLDELSYLIQKEEDLIYYLTRINDDDLTSKQRISLIGIVRDVSELKNLDNSTLSTLQKNIIKFSKYERRQIYDILKYRAEISLKKNTISDEIIKMVAEIVYNSGDVRLGLNILWRAAKITENKDLGKISIESIRLANQETVPLLTQDFLIAMNKHKLLFLLSIAKTLKKMNIPRSPLGEIMQLYEVICESLKIKPRSYSQLWNFIKELKKDNLISVKIKSKDIKGRKAFIGILEIPILELERKIINILKTKDIIL